MSKPTPTDEQEINKHTPTAAQKKTGAHVSKRKRTWPTHGSRLSQMEFKAVEYYCRGMTKTESLIKAGYSKATALKQQFRVFGREHVQKAIEERRWKHRTRSNEMVDRIKEELADIAFFNIGEIIEVTDDGDFIYDFSTATMEQFAAVGEVTVERYTEGKGKTAKEVKRVKVKPYNKLEALSQLARVFGLFQDNLTVSSAENQAERLEKARQRAKAPEVIEGEVVSRDT